MLITRKVVIAMAIGNVTTNQATVITTHLAGVIIQTPITQIRIIPPTTFLKILQRRPLFSCSFLLTSTAAEPEQLPRPAAVAQQLPNPVVVARHLPVHLETEGKVVQVGNLEVLVAPVLVDCWEVLEVAASVACLEAQAAAVVWVAFSAD
jgi:hypothetical protein